MHEAERAALIRFFSRRIAHFARLRQSVALCVVSGTVSPDVLAALDRCIFADYADLMDLGEAEAARTVLTLCGLRRGVI